MNITTQMPQEYQAFPLPCLPHVCSACFDKLSTIHGSICEKQTLFLLAIHLYLKPFKDFDFVLQTTTLFFDTIVFTTNAHLNGCL